MTEETKVIEAICGPYRGQRLTVSAADFDKAIADRGARDPHAERPHEPDEQPPEMTPEETKAALEAAEAWQTEQVEIAKGGQPKSERSQRNETRDMAPDETAGTYETRRGPGRPSTRR